jgi:mannose-6-phosphate isomerase-like protein (cupin superfamily)
MEEEIFELKDLLSKVRNSSSYFLEFINSGRIEAGIIKLRPGQCDTQEPHNKDELYYIIEGEGYIRIGSREYMLKQGTMIFIPAKTHHRFLKNNTDLIVLYVFGK